MTVGTQIKKFRELRGMTLESLAAVCGISKALLQMFEDDLIRPNNLAVLKIAGALDVDLAEIYNGDLIKRSNYPD